MTSEGEEYVAILKALYDYEPSSGDELAIKEDQILFLVERTDDEWWKVKHKPDSQNEETALAGLVPASYLEEAKPTFVVKALYDYEAAARGELSVTEDETLAVYDKDEDWLLVKSERDGGKIGYVPGNYVEESIGDEMPTETDASQIVIPDSPLLRSTSTYIDPADRVAATVDKAKADDIQTWSVSEVDKKGKKKKGTLGVGNGALFFASESDKTPVQKWQTSAIDDIKVEKYKHIHIEIGGQNHVSLRFNVGSKDTADAITKKLESSRILATGMGTTTPPDQGVSPSPTSPARPPISATVPELAQKPKKNGVTVHFAPSPALIPSPDSPVDTVPENEEDIAVGEIGAALYDFLADGEDELSVKEGEQLIILDRVSSDEWWKCRDVHGVEGVVPSSYIEAVGGATARAEAKEIADQEEAERVAAERARAEAEATAAEIAEAQARELAEAEKERMRQESDRKAKAAAAKAEKERKDQIHRLLEERRARERDAAEKRLAETTKLGVSDRHASHEDRDSKPRNSTEGQLKFPNEGKTRIWHDHSRQWRTEAEFLGVNKGKIRLHKINGVIIEVPPEKMSPDDVRYIESITHKKLAPPPESTPLSRSKTTDDDDVPLGSVSQRRSLQNPSPSRPTPPPKKAPTIDWFDFFLNAGCEIDDCTRYASSFERDKMDESILPDIKESTLRSLGLREGDIIRVSKAIEQRNTKTTGREDDTVKAQLARDEEIAKALQAEEVSGISSRRSNATSPPNLFAGPSGALRTQQRRGRPQPRGTAPPVNVDVNSIASASDQISRTGSPLIASPSAARATSPAIANPPKAASTHSSGFDDDAWTNRPSSTKPTSTPPVSTPAPPVPAPPAAPPAPPRPASPPVPLAPPQPPRPTSTNPSHPAQNPGQFELLAKIGQMRPPSAPALQTSLGHDSPIVASPPPQSFHSGLGMGSSPVPLGQHLQNPLTNLYQQPQMGPRGPLAPVPSNQGLLNPLIPTTTGFTQFVPTRPASNPSLQPTAHPPFQPAAQPSFLSTPPSGFGTTGSLLPQQTGFPGMAPSQANVFSGIAAQPTGFGSPFGGTANPNFMPNGFGDVQSNPTGFHASFSSPSFGNGSPLSSAAQPQKDHSPANVFAQMKSGTFGNEPVPQSTDKYDALRPQPTGWPNVFHPQGQYGSF